MTDDPNHRRDPTRSPYTDLRLRPLKRWDAVTWLGVAVMASLLAAVVWL